VRNVARAPEYAQLLADIAAGARLHYDDPGDDPDLALLQGDHLYARGLAQLAELGDLDAIGELAEAISRVAEARATGDRDRAAAAWAAGVAAVLAEVDGESAASPN
jgi:hypothetical protein